MTARPAQVVEAELAAFRQKVVDEALKATKQHGWCREAQAILIRLGLKDLLPPTYWVQRKLSAQSTWTDRYQEPTAKKAFDLVKDCQDSQNGQAARQHEHEHNPNAGQEYYEFKATLTAPTSIPPFVAPEYPKFRVVSRQPGSRKSTVIEPTKPTKAS